MTYTLRLDGGVSRDVDGAVIPPDPANSDWQAYQAWLVVPNTPNPAPSPPAPVVVVTRLQGRLALSRAGLLDKAESAVAAAGGETAIWYADAQSWRRDDPHVAAIGGALQLTAAQVDALFADAAGIV